MQIPEILTNVMHEQYYQPGEDKDPSLMLRRVAKHVAGVEEGSVLSEEVKTFEDELFDSMLEGLWFPSSPYLMNAGTKTPMLLACFVLGLQDNLVDIYKTLGEAAQVHKMGGGTGFDFSPLRHKGAPINSTGGTSSGALSFLGQFDYEGGIIKQGGRRRAANLGAMRIDHPEILDFIDSKLDLSKFTNFNLSTLLPDWFMNLVISKDNDDRYKLIDHNGVETGVELSAKEVFRRIVLNNWKSGEPGALYVDAINRDNMLEHLGRLTATNPCGEVPLLPDEACNLVSIILDKFIDYSGVIYWERLRDIVHLCVRFMDNGIDASIYPTKTIEEGVKRTRKIGLGIMGLHGLLIKAGHRYDSEEGRALAEEVIAFIEAEALVASIHLAESRGVPKGWYGSEYERNGIMVRNLTRLCIAPTGTISMIANASSSGCEPIFAVIYERNIKGDKYFVINPLFKEVGDSEGWLTDKVISKIVDNNGSVRGIPEVPSKWRELFITAGEIAPEDHVRMQAVLQKHVDNSISKTVNMPETATLEDVASVYLLAWELGCKGITIYRDKSREGVLTTGAKDKLTKVYSSSEDGRPDMLIGATLRIRSGCGKLWTTINPLGDSVWEVFSSTGSDGGCTSNIQEISRLISLAAREGISIEKILDQLKSVRCARALASKSCKVASCSDAIAKQIERFLLIYDSSEWSEFLSRQIAKLEDPSKPVVLEVKESEESFLESLAKSSGCRGGRCD